MGTISVTLTLDSGMHAALVKRAQSMGKHPADYLRQLVDAAYAARVGYEKKLPASDDDLDQAVRAVFCLAGEFDARAIARATGFPANMVGDILKGFAIVAPTLRSERPTQPQETAKGDPATGENADGTVTPAEARLIDEMSRKIGQMRDDSAAAPPLRHGWPPEIYEKVREMWAAGDTSPVIAKAIGKTAGALSVWAGKNRDICPKRLMERSGA